MKKVLISFFVLISLLLTGCQETSISNSNSNSNESSEFVDSSTNDESSTTDEISNYIKNIYVNKINSESKKTISTDDVNILCYLGQYGKSYIAIIEGDCMAIPEKTIVIGDLTFEYVLEVISVYNDDTYYDLKEAYELGLVDHKQLLDIYNIYQEYKYNINLK